MDTVSKSNSRSNQIRGVAARFRKDAPDAKSSAVLLAAEVDVAAALLFAHIEDGKTGRDLLTAYTRLVELRLQLLTRLKIILPLVRAKVSDEDDDPLGYGPLVERQERELLERARTENPTRRKI